jgi:hypothetical protein
MESFNEEKCLINFLQKNYPTYRLKYKNYFKRAILFDNGETYILSDKKHTKNLYEKLFNNILLIFDSDKTITKNVLKGFLNMK